MVITGRGQTAGIPWSPADCMRNRGAPCSVFHRLTEPQGTFQSCMASIRNVFKGPGRQERSVEAGPQLYSMIS